MQYRVCRGRECSREDFREAGCCKLGGCSRVGGCFRVGHPR